MKKLTLMLVALMVAISLTLTACNNNTQPSSADEPAEADVVEQDDAEEETPEPAEADGEEEDTDADEAPADSQAAMDELMADAAELEALMEQMMGGVATCKISSEGSTFKFSVQFTEELEDGASEMLDEYLDSMGAAFEAMLGEMETAGVESPVVVVEYLDVDGAVLSSVDFK